MMHHARTSEVLMKVSALLFAVGLAAAGGPRQDRASQPASAGGTEPERGEVLWRADYSDYPNAGFGAAETKSLDQRFTREFLPTGGPVGRPAHRLKMRYCETCNDFGGQFNWGNRANLFDSDPPPGTRRYYRFRMRVSGNNRGRSWDDGAPSDITNKVLIVGQGCGRGCRFILTYETADGGGIRNFRIQKDGGEDLDDTGSFPPDKWLSVQVELLTGKPGASDGGYRLWVNNGDYKRPDAKRDRIELHGANHRYVWLGGFVNDGLMSDGTHVLDLADFEIGTAFDPDWHRVDEPKDRKSATEG